MNWKPTREIEIVAGTPPGGGLDRSARALLRAIESTGLIDVPVRVINVGGDGGRKGWEYIAPRAGDAHTVLINAPNLIADHLMGVTHLDFMQFSALANLYTEYIAFVVHSDSGIASGADLLRQLARDPRKVTFAFSTSRGNTNHVAIAKVIQHAGAALSAVPIHVFDTAPDAVADTVAGRASVAAVTAASAVTELNGGQLRAIAISSPSRLPGIYAMCPTWSEQAVDCMIGSWRGVSGPPRLAPAQIAFWENVLAAAVKTEEWKTDLARHFWMESFLIGEDLQNHLLGEHEDTRAILRQLGLLSA